MITATKPARVFPPAPHPVSSELDIPAGEFASLGRQPHEAQCVSCLMLKPKAFIVSGICGDCQ